jgi:F5/8 type C domain/Secretion system C-terminal sorting domain/PKD-like domain
LPAGWSGGSTNTSLTATAGTTGGIISVRASNSCGAGPTQTLSVTVSTPTSNLALNRPATVSSIEPTTTFSSALAFDGNLTTRWSSGYSNAEWIYVDLGNTYLVNRVTVTWEAAYAVAYDVQISSNATTWTTIKAVTGNTTLVNDHTGLSGSGRYVRINGITRSTQWGYSIFEFEVYGALAGGKAAFDEQKVTLNTFDIFPNPTIDVLHIDAHDFSQGSMMLMDITGRTFMSADIIPSSVDVSLFPVGLYFVKLSKGSRVAIKKFKKE